MTMFRLIMLPLLSLMFLMQGFTFAEAAEPFKALNIGKLKVVSVLSQPHVFDTKLLHGSQATIDKYAPDGKCEGAFNSFIVDDGKNVVMFDTGLSLASGSALIPNMEAAGYSPDNITAVIMTHLHGDHIGGAFFEKDGEAFRQFKNAKLYINKKEFDALKNKDEALIGKISAAYADDLVTFSDEKEFIKGIKPIKAYGHTEGHTIYEVGSGKDKILMIGDLIHCISVQINDLNISIAYDTDEKAAVKERIRLFRYAADNKIPVAGAHIPAGGIVVLTEKGGKYSYKVY